MEKKYTFLVWIFAGAMSGFSGAYFLCNWRSSDDEHRAIISPHISLSNASKSSNVVPLVVIGSGCAGWSAALYGARGGVKTLVIEGSKPGGQLSGTTQVENWPGIDKDLGPQIMDRLREQAIRFGAEVLSEEAVEVSFDHWPYAVTTQSGIVINAYAIVIATGASPRLLGIPGEQEYWGKGVTTCAICDAAFHKEKDVIVIGGGDSAVEQVLQLAPYAKNIIVAVRSGKMRAAPAMQARLADVAHARVMYHTKALEVEGDGAHVTGVKLYNEEKHETIHMPISGFFLAIGHEPNTKIFKGSIELDKEGYILTHGKTQKTNIEGVFAAGDVEDSVYRQAGVAAGSGIKAALDAIKFLQDIGFNHAESVARAETFFSPSKAVTRTAQEPFVIKNVISDDEFKAALQTDKLLVVDFYTKVCPTCKIVERDIIAYAPLVEDNVLFIKTDAAVVEAITQEYSVTEVPTLLLFKKGELVGRYAPKKGDAAVKFIQEALK